MKRPRNNRPEPRTELIGLNLTNADLAQLDELFAALKPTSPRHPKVRRLTRSTVAYQCFATGLDHELEDKPFPQPAEPYDWDNRPKRNAKLVGIYLSETDCKKLIKLDSLIERRFWGSSLHRGGKRDPFQLNRRTPLAYACFRRGLALMLAKQSSRRATAPATVFTTGPAPNAPRST